MISAIITAGVSVLATLLFWGYIFHRQECKYRKQLEYEKHTHQVQKNLLEEYIIYFLVDQYRRTGNWRLPLVGKGVAGDDFLVGNEEPLSYDELGLILKAQGLIHE